MKKIFILIFFLFTIVAYANYSIIWNWPTDSTHISHLIKFDTEKQNTVAITNPDASWNRLMRDSNMAITNIKTNSWILNSDMYWEFYIIKDKPIVLTLDKNNTTCKNLKWDTVSYYEASWYFFNPYFWNYVLDSNNSYFCWWFDTFKLVWNIWWIGEVTIATSTDIVEKVKTWVNVVTDWWQQILSNRDVDISWKMINTQYSINTSKVTKDDTITSNKYLVENNTKIDLLEFNKIIEKNLLSITKNILPNTTDYTLSNFNNINNNKWSYKISWENYFYYKYTWDWTFNNSWNKWKILTLWDSINLSDVNPIKVNWKNTLILNWWNLYINSDIDNTDDKTDILTIVVKRNWKNWWNVYINPNVTNIDAIIIADGSIMSFDWNQILTSKIDDTDILRRQLLIYWTVISKNNLWEWNDKVPYWWDSYSWNNSVDNTMKYNLSYLRNFRLAFSHQITSWQTCYKQKDDVKYYIIAVDNTEDNWLKYAFAWKKACYSIDNSQSWLRTTKKLAPLVIEYNSLIATNPPKILLK